MAFDRIDRTGFAPPSGVRTGGGRCTAVAQLITSIALVVSIAVAATAVSMGMARADGFPAVAADSSTHVAVLLALVHGRPYGVDDQWPGAHERARLTHPSCGC